VQAAATELVVPQALGGWALVLRYGSTIGPCHDRTAPSFDIVASIGAGVKRSSARRDVQLSSSRIRHEWGSTLRRAEP